MRYLASTSTTLRVSWLLVLLSACAVAETRAQKACALLLGGYGDDCVVIAADGVTKDVKPMLELSAGDRISQRSGVDGIRTKCSPFTRIVKEDAATLRVVYSPPESKTGLLRELVAFLGFEQERYGDRTVATRSALDELPPPQPGAWATVLPGERFVLTWKRQDQESTFFQDSSGQEVFRKAADSTAAIGLSPEEIGLQPSVVYSWGIDVKGVPGRGGLHRIMLLDRATSELVKADLKKIDEEVGAPGERILRKAGYLQFISDAYETEIDLYWKSYGFLYGLDLNALSAESKTLWQLLVDRCLDHLEKQAAEDLEDWRK